ncbi:MULTISPECIES: universal stress protein [Streptomyces]|uniref:universal stress protein n=1 Tax=Streptomyces TaxID=1883 RepID=UPI0004C58A15|nr:MULTISPECIES: universal stress protein [Streptomyces]
MTHRHVVVGVDGSLIAVRALDQAAQEAVRRAAGLHILYAVSDRDASGPVLASAAARVHGRHPELPVTTSAVESTAVESLVHESEEAALTVVGTRGLTGVTGLLVGAVGPRLAARARGPLMVVRHDLPRDRGTCAGERPVLLALQGDGDTDVAAYAFEEAEWRGVTLRVVHATPHRHLTPRIPSPLPATSPGRRRQVRGDPAEEAVPRLGVVRPREQHPQVCVDARTGRLSPAHALLEATREASVVVIGTHRHVVPLGRHLGPVARTLLHHSHCPVVLVPTPGG